MSSDSELIAALRAQLKATEARAAKAEAKATKAEARADRAEARADRAETRADCAEKLAAALRKAVDNAKTLGPIVCGMLKQCIDEVAKSEDLPEIQRKQLTEQLAEFSSVFANMDQLGKLVAWQENKQSESIGKSVLKSEKAAPAEVQTAVLSTDRSINKRQRLMDKSLNFVCEAAKQLGENAPAFADVVRPLLPSRYQKRNCSLSQSEKKARKPKGVKSWKPRKPRRP